MSSKSSIRDESGYFQLIETFGFFPQRAYVRLELHLERMARSARALDFVFDQKAITRRLYREIGELEEAGEPLRIRLLLHADGVYELTCHPFKPVDDNCVWKVAIAETRLDSSNAMLAHKITRRELYEQARAEFPLMDADEVILCNENNEICEGSFTNIFVKDVTGETFTPHFASGLLPGILRQDLLSKGKVHEKLLFADDLRAKGNEIFVGNSLRGLIHAELIN